MVRLFVTLQYFQCFGHELLYYAFIASTVLHAFNLDTIPPCFGFKKIFGSKLVFDMHDRYAIAFIPWNKGIFFKRFHFIGLH